MKSSRTRLLYFLTLALLVSWVASACQMNISRSGQGVLAVETSISQEALQSAIDAAIADPLVKELSAALQSGYVLVSAERGRSNNPDKTDTLSFRLDLGVSNGMLTASISNAVLDGVPLDPQRINTWNENIASRLQKIGQNQSNVTLQAVRITPDGVWMTWQIVKQ